jgi:hypothetical protein
METRTTQQCQRYLDTFIRPDSSNRHLMGEGKIGLILLSAEQFKYDRSEGYSFETAVVAEQDTGNRFLFIRIDAWNPEYRAKAQSGEIDYCIPIAYPGASDRERLKWTIPMGGAWSDTTEKALVVFDSSWRAWFESLTAGLAFSSPGEQSGAFMNWSQHDLKDIRAFCA